MADDTLVVSLVSDVFPGESDDRLRARLHEARARGAELALLPELPLDAWHPAGRDARDEDAEPPEGPRHRRLAAAAREAGLALVGGAIVRDPASGRRCNTALVFDAAGRFVAGYGKLHLPDEPGFWETCHYRPGTAPPRTIAVLGFPLGLQICSDANRPAGTHLLSATGADAILVPRASERTTFDRWRLVLRANAITATTYVLSVNRPRPELGVDLGGPSIAIGPDGDVLLETTEPIATITLDRRVIADARRRYPGYVAWQPDVYAAGWLAATRRS